LAKTDGIQPASRPADPWVIFAGEKAALEFLDAGNFESLRLIFAMIWSNLSQFSADF